MLGKQSIQFQNPPCIINSGSIVGSKEGQGPMGKLFDKVGYDDMFGAKTWEEAESALQREALQIMLEKENLKKEEIQLCGRFARPVHREQLRPFFFSYAPYRIIRRMFHMRPVHRRMQHGRCGRFCGQSGLCDVQPLCQCGERVPFPAFLWESASAFGYLDRYRQRRISCCGRLHEKSQS